MADRDEPTSETVVVIDIPSQARIWYQGNVDQTVILVTEDKLRLCLERFERRRAERNAWHAPLGMFLTIITTLVTMSPRDVVFNASVWTATYLMGAILTAIWLIRAASKAYRARRDPTAAVEGILREIRGPNGT
jgi:deoxyribodipyrimidine photolyase-like uncharacterized protein